MVPSFLIVNSTVTMRPAPLPPPHCPSPLYSDMNSLEEGTGGAGLRNRLLDESNEYGFLDTYLGAGARFEKPVLVPSVEEEEL